MTHRRARAQVSVLVAAVIAAVALCGCGSSSTSETVKVKSVSVAIRAYKFQPASLSVAKGTTVTWQNYDSDRHTVTTDAGAALAGDSGTLQQSSRFTLKLTKSGTLHYHCNVHPFMQGVIQVKS